MSNRRRTLTSGSEKLQKTNQMVGKLSQNIVNMQPLLGQSIKDAEQMAKQIEKESMEAHRSRLAVESEKRIVDKQTAEVEYQYN